MRISNLLRVLLPAFLAFFAWNPFFPAQSNPMRGGIERHIGTNHFGRVAYAAYGQGVIKARYGHGRSHRGHGHYRHYGHNRHYGHYRHRGHYGHYGYRHYPSRHYRYRYRSYPYYRYPHRNYSYPYRYRDEQYRNRSPAGYAAELAQGWDHLKENRPRRALETFGAIAQDNPSKGAPKIGYALASAELEQHEKAVWAMRRALRNEADALHYVTLDNRLQTSVSTLADRYARSSAYGNDADRYFLLASLYFLLNNPQAAYDSLIQGQKAGDDSVSAKNLEHLVTADIGTQSP